MCCVANFMCHTRTNDTRTPNLHPKCIYYSENNSEKNAIISHIHCGDVLSHNENGCSHWCDFVSSGTLLHLLDATSIRLHWNCSFELCHAKRFNAFHTLKHVSSISSRRMDNVFDSVYIIVERVFFSGGDGKKVPNMTLAHIQFSYITTQSCLIDCWNASEFSISPSFSITGINFICTIHNDNVRHEKSFLIRSKLFRLSVAKTSALIVVVVQRYGRLKWLISPLHNQSEKLMCFNRFSVISPSRSFKRHKWHMLRTACDKKHCEFSLKMHTSFGLWVLFSLNFVLWLRSMVRADSNCKSPNCRWLSNWSML